MSENDQIATFGWLAAIATRRCITTDRGEVLDFVFNSNEEGFGVWFQVDRAMDICVFTGALRDDWDRADGIFLGIQVTTRGKFRKLLESVGYVIEADCASGDTLKQILADVFK
jgi:hypothetical protein